LAHNIVPICTFAEELFRLENGEKIKLFPHQRKFLTMAFTPDEDGKLPYSTVCWSSVKKSGKTCINSMVTAWFLYCVCELNDTIIMVANSREHVQSLAFRGLTKAIELEPLLKSSTPTIGMRSIITDRGVQVLPLSTEYGTASGANFSLVSMDEIWAMTDESSRRLYEELTPVPTRKNSVRFVSTYAGHTGSSEILESLYNRGMQGKCVDEEHNVWINEDAGLFMMWDHKPRFPWQTEKYYSEQRAILRPSAYARLHENMWTAGEEGLDITDWQACVAEGEKYNWTKEKAWTKDKNIHLAVGVDASVKHDRAAVVSCFRRSITNEEGRPVNKIFLGPRLMWQPSSEEPLDFEETIEKFILSLQENYMLGPVFYDPFQFVRSAQTLWKLGVNTVEFNQTVPNGVEMCNHLMDLLRMKNLAMYEDIELLKEAQSVSLKEIPGRGYRITKDTSAKKIDSIIALSMAALAAEKVPCSDDSFADSFFVLR